jgi:uncharacterized membrane protein
VTRRLDRPELVRPALAVLVVLCGLTLALGFVNKDRCTGPEFDQDGRSTPGYDQRSNADVCYSDIQYLWLGRDVNKHVFPYVHGDLDSGGSLTGGSLEYPVLTGLLVWAGAAFAHTDAGFLALSALLLAPFGLLVAWLLGKLAGWRALLWSLGPPLVLYAFHNWDLPAVACSAGAFALTASGRWSFRTRTTVAAVLLGLGFSVKLYPAIFLLPLAAYVCTEGGERIRGALRVLGAGVGTAVLVNLPFALAGFNGWWASFAFQAGRKIDVSTDSLWFWAFRPVSGSSDATFQTVAGILSPLLVLGSFALALTLGWRRYRREGGYPLIQVAAAMLCGFLLLHKVHSPQYTLWLLPMFVLVRVRLGWVFAYLAADLAMGIGIFRWFAELQRGGSGGIYEGFAGQAVMLGVWGRAALLAGLFFAFLAAEPAYRLPSRDGDLVPRESLTR